MSFDKAIKYHKTHRTPYYGNKAIDPSCRNHGSCPICYSNRTYKNRKRLDCAQDKLRAINLYATFEKKA